MIDPTLTSAIELFHSAADAVGAVLAANSNWGASGIRHGQYAVDLDADAVCIGLLHGAGYRVLSEESGVSGGPGSTSAPIVVVDPLDGSTNASRQIPWYATALCLVDGDGPAAAMVANHATGERFAAIRGAGAHRDGQTIRPSAVTELSEAMIGLSGLPTHHYGWSQYRTMGASAPDICMVACGVTDGWTDTGSYHGVWDYLASVLILTEAGGVAAEASGLDLCVLDHKARRGPVVAATPRLLEQLLTERHRGPGNGHSEPPNG